MRIDFYNDVCSVALTPDRKYAIVGCFRGGQLNIIEFNNFDNPFDFGNEKTIITIDDDDEHNYCINSIQTTNDSKYFIFTYYDGIQIWNIESKQCVLNVRDS